MKKLGIWTGTSECIHTKDRKIKQLKELNKELLRGFKVLKSGLLSDRSEKALITRMIKEAEGLRL